MSSLVADTVPTGAQIDLYGDPAIVAHMASGLQGPAAGADAHSTFQIDPTTPHNDVINGAIFIVPKQVVAAKIIAIDEVVQPPSKQSWGDCQPTMIIVGAYDATVVNHDQDLMPT